MKVVRVLVPGLVLVLVLGGMLAVAVVVGTAGAAGAPSQPLPVSGASLIQNGQDLVWQVELARTFSPGALARAHESLCLVIDQKSSFELCVAGPAHGRHTPSLREIPSGGGGGKEIAAAITRSSDRELTASFLPSSIGPRFTGRCTGRFSARWSRPAAPLSCLERVAARCGFPRRRRRSVCIPRFSSDA